MKGQESDPIINEVSLANIAGVSFGTDLTVVIGRLTQPEKEKLVKRTFKNKVRKKST